MLNVSIKNLEFSYNHEQGVVLGDINMEVEKGDFVCILGQSGCGKSTLLRLLAGLEDPTSGQLLIEGESIKGAGLQRGVVFQDYGLFPWMTTGENITIAIRHRFPNMSKAEQKERVLYWMKNVDRSSNFPRFMLDKSEKTKTLII